jgi:asparaginyl-tRNA synthetase
MIQDSYQRISDLFSMKEAGETSGKPVALRGWIRTNRDNGHIGFIELNDGSCFSGCQIVYDMDANAALKEAARYLTGCSIEVSGTFQLTPEAKQPFEVHAGSITLLGGCDPDFPMQKKRHSLEFLREMPHLRTRTNTFSALFRVRSVLCAAIHDYLQQNGFLYITTPLITGNDAEGAGEVFTVTTRDDAKYEEDFFGKHACLTVSGQLHVEPFALTYGRVYTFGPTFRAEKSKTRRHLTEFWMVEPEVAFCDLDQLMEIGEQFISHIVRRVLETCAPELKSLKRDISKLEKITPPFPRISYDDAIHLIDQQREESDDPEKKELLKITWGMDFGAPHETVLTNMYEKPLFVYGYPTEVKAFYMEPWPGRPEVCKSVDLLAPEGYGEIIGGSERISNYDLLLKRLREQQLPEDAFKWYLELRRFGSVPHSGFGMGIERTVAWICGIEHIREAIAFPRTIKRVYP